MSLIRLIIILLVGFAGAGPVFAAPAGTGPKIPAVDHRAEKRSIQEHRSAIREEMRDLQRQIRTCREPKVRQALMRKRAELRASVRPARSNRAANKGGN